MAKKKSRSKISKSKRRQLSRSKKTRDTRKTETVEYQALEPRQLLAVTTLPFVSTGEFNQFSGGESISQGFGIRGVDSDVVATEPRFLGFTFDESVSVGGFEDGFFSGTQWGAQVDADVDGRFGIEYGFFISDGLGSIVSQGDFQYEVVPGANGFFTLTTDTLVDDSRLQTISPTISAYADLVVVVDAEIASRACAGVFGCAGDLDNPAITDQLDVDESVELISLNRQLDGADGIDANGNPVFDGEFRLLDIGIGEEDEDGDDPVEAAQNARQELLTAENAETQALSDLNNASSDSDRAAASQRLQEARQNKADATAKNNAARDRVSQDNKIEEEDSDGAGFGLSIGPADGGLLGVKATLAAEVQVGVVGASKEFGSLQLTLPEVNLSSSSPGDGTLFATTEDGVFDKDRSEIARLDLNVGTLLSAYVPGLGTTGVSVGPIEASVTTVEYTLGATLDVTQDVEAKFAREVVTATFGTLVTVPVGTILLNANGDAFLTENGFQSNVLRFERGDDIQFKAVDQNAGEVTVDFQLDREYTINNDVGLGFGLDGEISAFAASLEASFGPLDFTFFDIGPLYSDSHDLASANIPAFSFDEYTASSVADFDEVTINLKPDVTVALENQSSVIVDDSNSDFDGAFSFDAVITNIGLADADNVSLDLQELNLVGTELTAVDEQGAPIGTLTVSSNGETATLTGLGTLASDESIRVTFTGQTDAIGGQNALYTANLEAMADGDVNGDDDIDTNIPVRQTTSFVVSSSADTTFNIAAIDSDSDFCSDGANSCTLREAVYSAESTGLLVPATINVEVAVVNLNSSISSGGDDPEVLTNRFRIIGKGSAQTTIVGPANSSTGLIRFFEGIELDPFLLQGVTLAGEVGGSSTSSTGTSPKVLASSTDLVLDDVVIRGHANTSSGSFGGGFLAFRSDVTVKNSTIEGNSIVGSSTRGGGGIAVRFGNLTVENSKITDNTANPGGAIFAGDGANVNIINSDLDDNEAVRGGAIFAEGGVSVTIVNSNLSGNEADRGAAIFSSTADNQVHLEDVRVTNNTATAAAGGIIEAISPQDAFVSAEQLVIYGNDGDNFVNTDIAESWASVANDLGAQRVIENYTDFASVVNLGIYDQNTNGGITYEFTYTVPASTLTGHALLGANRGTGELGRSASLKLDQTNSGGRYGVTNFASDIDFVSNTNRAVNERTHVAFVADGTDMLLYVNGNFVDRIDGASVEISGTVRLGGTFGGSSQILPADSVIHGFAAYDRALSPAEIVRTASAGLFAATNSLLNVSDDDSLEFGPEAGNGFQSKNVDSLVRFELSPRLAEAAGTETSLISVVLADTPGAEVSRVFWTLPGREIESSASLHPDFEIDDSGFVKLVDSKSLTPGTVVSVNIQGTDTEGNKFEDTVLVKAFAAPTTPTNVASELRVIAPEDPDSNEEVEDDDSGAFLPRTTDSIRNVANIEWDYVADTEYTVRAFTVDANGQSDGINRQVEISPANDQTTSSANNNGRGQVQFLNLLPNTNYRFSVEARNFVGSSEVVATGVQLTHRPAPTAVKITSAVEDADTNTIKVDWLPSENADGYRVFINDQTFDQFFFNDRGEPCSVGDPLCTVAATVQHDDSLESYSIDIPGTQPDTVYKIQIHAVNAGGTQIGRVSVETDMLAPEVPTNVTARGISPTRALVEWNSSLRATEYQIVGRIVGETDFEPFFFDQVDNTAEVQDYVPIAAGTERKVVDGLTPGKNYEFRVIAAHADADSASAIAAAQTINETPGLFVTTTDDVVNPDDFQTSLREAINFANTFDADGDGSAHDRIRFDIDGVFLQDAANPQTIQLSQELEVTDSLTIFGETGIQLTGQNANRVFFAVGNRIDLTLQKLVLQNGRSTVNATSAAYEGQGGAILFDSDGVLQLIDSRVENSTASSTVASNNVSGGAIHSTGDVGLLRTAIVGNTATGNNPQGGGIYSAKQIATNNSFIDGNTANATGFTNQATFENAKGGGLSALGRIRLNDSTISNNVVPNNALGGGGVYTSGSVTLNGSVVDQNSATGSDSEGGGIFAGGTVTSNSSTISNNSINGPTVRGGGIAAVNAYLTNTTIAGNDANGTGNLNTGRGGGVSADTLSIYSSTLTNNSVDGFGSAVNVTSSVTFSNSIVLGNEGPAGEIFTSNGATLTQVGNNILSNYTVEDIFQDTVGGAALLGVNGATAVPGGPVETIVKTFALKLDPANPALDLNVSSTVQLDARGNERAVDFPGNGGGFVDAGAFEAGDLLIVDSLEDSADLPGFTTLREAINLANSLDDFDEIEFASRLSGQRIDLNGELPVITQELTIDASELEERLVLDAGSQSRHITFDGSGSLTLDSLELINGSITGDSSGGSDTSFVGGSIRFLSDTNGAGLYLTNSRFSDNSTTGLAAIGGAIFAGEADVISTGSEFTNNSTNGYYGLGGAIFANSVFLLDANIFENNRTQGDKSPGGAIFAVDGFTTGELANFSTQGSTFRGNRTEGDDSPGGAVRFDDGQIGQSVFASNETRGANSGGGALAIYSAAKIFETNFESNLTRGSNSPGGAVHVPDTSSPQVEFDIATSSFIDNGTRGPDSPGGAVNAERGTVTAEAISVIGNSTAGLRSPGGGISISDDSSIGGFLFLQQGTIAGNSTAQNYSPGGGIAAGAVDLRFTTVTGNSTSSQASGSPGGNYSPGGGIHGKASLFNSVILGNYSSGSQSNDLHVVDGVLALFGLNLVGSDPNDFAPRQDSVYGGNTINANPEDVFASITPVRFDSNGDGTPDTLSASNILGGLPVDNGGRRLTIGLNPNLAANAALDAGIDTNLTVDEFDLDNDGDTTELISVDANGNIRIVGLGASSNGFARSNDEGDVDLGATELPGTTREEQSLVVTTLDDSEYAYDGVTSLREAIAFAESGDADEINGDVDRITFDPSLAGQTIQLDGVALEITQSLIIDASDIGGITIDALERSRVIHFDGLSGNLTLNGLTLTSGRAEGVGAGVRFDSTGILTLQSSRLTDNQTDADAAGGGGIYAVGNVVLNNSVLDNNRTRRGNSPGGAVQSMGNVTINSSTLSNNYTNGSNSSGGAVSAEGRLSITNATIVKNSVAGSQSTGGGLHTGIGSTISNSIILDNSSAFDPASSEINRDAFHGFVNGNIIGESSFTFDTDGTSVINAEFEDIFTDTELTDNGGSLLSFALLPSTVNPALDGGRLPNASETTDGRGLPRGVDLPGISGDAPVDLGAYELQTGVEELPSLFVTTDSDVVDPFDFATSLREAVAFANDTTAGSLNDGDADEDGFVHDTITFSESLRGKTITLRADDFTTGTRGELRLTSSATIAGLGADQLTISGNNDSRILNFAASGAAEFTVSDVTLTGGVVPRGSQASPEAGGAILLNNGNDKLTIERSVISDSAANGGGAIFFGGTGSELNIEDSALIDNIANYSGSALLTFGNTTTTIVNSTISGNESGNNSGAIFQQTVGSDVAAMEIRNSTIANNTGYGVFNSAATTATTITLGNTILADNINRSSIGGGGTITSLGNNLADDGPASLNGPDDQTNVDPLLSPLALNGGTTPTHALDFNSTAIDGGSNLIALDAEDNPLTSDQSGSGRISEGTVDIGAFEFVPRALNFLVDASVDTDDGIVTPGNLSLREAVRLANENVGFSDTITFDSNAFDSSTILSVDSEIVVTESLSIIGLNESITIDGDQNTRLFRLASPGEATYTFKNVNLANGNAGTSTGGAIHLVDNDDTLILDGVVLAGNRANGGGAIRVSGAEYLIKNSSFISNHANFNGSAILAVGEADGLIFNSTFTSNTSDNNGAAILLQNASAEPASLKVINATIADTTGRGIHAVSSGTGTTEIEIGNSILSDNSGNNVAIGGTNADVVSLGFNISDDGSTALSETTDMVNTDPSLGDFGVNGGSNFVYSLQPDSPAIDAGSNALAVDENGDPLETDQRGDGFGRFFDGNNDGVGTVDIGAFEAQEVRLVGQNLFYNNSSFDQTDVSGAIASDKVALRNGQTATFENYTSFVHGINGIAIDLFNPVSLIDSDFQLRFGNVDDVGTWTPLDSDSTIISRTVLTGEGVNGSDRVILEFADGSITNGWLQVTVVANAFTGVSNDEVFYFGNLIGEVSGPSGGKAVVNSLDFGSVSANFSGIFDPALPIDDLYDINRDNRVNSFDAGILSSNFTPIFQGLNMITPSDGSANNRGSGDSNGDRSDDKIEGDRNRDDGLDTVANQDQLTGTRNGLSGTALSSLTDDSNSSTDLAFAVESKQLEVASSRLSLSQGANERIEFSKIDFGQIETGQPSSTNRGEQTEKLTRHRNRPAKRIAPAQAPAVKSDRLRPEATSQFADSANDLHDDRTLFSNGMLDEIFSDELDLVELKF